MKKTALIGHTGFVGSNIKRFFEFTDYYNSKNIHEIEGKTFDLVISSGTYAVKWWANKHPEEDWHNIKKLIKHLGKIKAKKFILISTVDVYPNPQGVNELTQIEIKNLHPYGLNRLKLEWFIKETFPNYTIIRLPGLFGQGLKKNFIFDILNNQENSFVHPKNVFQFYNLSRIGKDLQKILEFNPPLINLVTEPTSVIEIAKFLNIKNFTGNPNLKPVKYNIHTIYAKEFGPYENYIEDKKNVLKGIKEFINKNKTL